MDEKNIAERRASMRKFDFRSVTDCELIFSYGDYVVFSGKNPWIFRKDGTYIAKLKQIRNAYNMVFLPGNMVLMDGILILCFPNILNLSQST